jgi:hypothetical protein
MDKEKALLGLLLCVIGAVVLLPAGIQGAVFLLGIGLSFVAVSLGEDAVEDLFNTFKEIFESIFESIFNR